MKTIEVGIKFSANPAEGIRAFGDLKKSVADTRDAFQAATKKTAEMARAMRESQQSVQSLAVQVALGKQELARLGDAVGKKAPEYLALKASLKEVEMAWKQANAKANKSAKAFDAAKASAAGLKDRPQGQMEALQRTRQNLSGQGVNTTALAAERARLQQAYDAVRAQAAKNSAIGAARDALGVRPFADVRAEIDGLQRSYATLKASGTASLAEIAQAKIRLIEKTQQLKAETNGIAAAFVKVRESLAGMVAATATLLGGSKAAISFESAMKRSPRPWGLIKRNRIRCWCAVRTLLAEETGWSFS